MPTTITIVQDRYTNQKIERKKSDRDYRARPHTGNSRNQGRSRNESAALPR